MNALQGAALLIGALILAWLLAWALVPLVVHHAVRTERFADVQGEGDICPHDVCACGASRPTGGGRWSNLLCRY